MGDSSRLTDLQSDFMDVWFGSSKDFFLTGGGALIGLYGLPRVTQDLDLFTTSAESFARVADRIRDCCSRLGAVEVALVTSPHFRRFRLERGDEVTLADFVEDLVPQICPEKVLLDSGWVVDRAEEIIVNKVCAIVGRGEPRDFYDFHFLVSQGYDPEVALNRAVLKDGGVTAESLAMVLQSVPWEQFRMRGLDTRETAAFFVSWLDRLTLRLYPD